LTGKKLNPVHGNMDRRRDFALKGFIKRLIVIDVTREVRFPAGAANAPIATGKTIIKRMSPTMLPGNFPQIVEYVTICLIGREVDTII
jgi:hypothetical protein